jgi:hypothetical protein
MRKKKLYAILWVDDYGSLKLNKKDIKWYHENAGPISFALEYDDRFPKAFDIVLSSKSGEDFSYDYLAYHFHPIRYTGLKTPKKIYDLLNLYYHIHNLQRIYKKIRTKIPLKKKFRILCLPLFLVLIYLLFRIFCINFIAFSIILIFNFVIFFITIIWYYVQSPNNWECPISDKEWIIETILRAKKEFEKRGLKFPEVIRHGWNLPWEGSIKFYKEIGVLADASAVPIGVDSNPRIENRRINWSGALQPYYTSLKGDYNDPWDGVDEQDKGILELPVTLGNISVYGFGEIEKKIIETLPEEGLVSVYIHPQDDFSSIKEWVNYLKNNYDVKFITARDAVKIYSIKHF